jgi:hypothetical protein
MVNVSLSPLSLQAMQDHWPVIYNILVYKESLLDCVLNYVALVASLVPVVLCLRPLSPTRGKFFWIPLSVGLFIFQVCHFTNVYC